MIHLYRLTAKLSNLPQWVLATALDIIYMDVISRDFFLQFRLLIWTSFIGQFVNPVGGVVIGKNEVDGR